MSNIFKVYKSSAWQEPEDVKKYNSSAWESCESVKRYKDGAWTEIWSSLKFTGSKNTMTTGYGGLGSDSTYGECLWYYAEQDGGYVEVWVDGEFVNPTVTASVNGSCYIASSDRDISVGTFSFFADSTYASKGSVNSPEELTTFTHTFSGTFSKVGFKIKFNNRQVESISTFGLYEFTINGMRVKLTDVSNYDYI